MKAIQHLIVLIMFLAPSMVMAGPSVGHTIQAIDIPDSVNALYNDAGKIHKIFWSPADKAKRYRVREVRKNKQGKWKTLKRYGTTVRTKRKVTPVRKGKKVCYQVRAIKKKTNKSGWTAPACFTKKEPVVVAPDPVESPDYETSLYGAVEKRAFDVVNDHRATIGSDALEWHNAISEQARQHSVNMANGTVPPSHDGFSDRIDAIELQIVEYNGGAENVAWNYSSDPGQQALNWWLTSAGHKRSLESTLYDLTGIGAARATDGKYYITQMFVNTD